MKIKKYLIIDFDSTFIQDEVLEKLGEITLENHPQKKIILKKITSICKLGMEGKIAFQDSLNQRLKLIQANKNSLKKLIGKLKNRITPSILKNKNFFHQNSQQIFIISGGFKEVITPVVKDFQIPKNHILANTFIYDKNGNIIGIDKNNPLAYNQGKAIAVQKLKLSGKKYVLGDGYTDYEIKKLGVADYFIAFTENVKRDNVVKNADCEAKNFEEFLKFYLSS